MLVCLRKMDPFWGEISIPAQFEVAQFPEFSWFHEVKQINVQN